MTFNKGNVWRGINDGLKGGYQFDPTKPLPERNMARRVNRLSRYQASVTYPHPKVNPKTMRMLCETFT